MKKVNFCSRSEIYALALVAGFSLVGFMYKTGPIFSNHQLGHRHRHVKQRANQLIVVNGTARANELEDLGAKVKTAVIDLPVVAYSQNISECLCSRKLMYPPQAGFNNNSHFNGTGDVLEGDNIKSCCDEGALYQSGQNVISICFWRNPNAGPGSVKYYQRRVLRNLEMMRKLYPGHSIRLYTNLQLNIGELSCETLCKSQDLFWCDILPHPIGESQFKMHTKNRYKLASGQEIFGNIKDPSSKHHKIKTFYNTTLYPPGVLLHLKGGIGNQLFQYACSYALARELNWPLYIFHKATPSPKSREFKSGRRDFALDQFQIPVDNVFDGSTTLARKAQQQNDETFLKRRFVQNKDIDKQFITLRREAHCQSSLYWKPHVNEIKTMFEVNKWALDLPKLKGIIQKIENAGESVVVHVRRGDFVNYEGFYIPMSYTRHAIRKMVTLLKGRGKENAIFFVFSDDMKFAKDNLQHFEEQHQFIFVSEEVGNSTSIEEFYLMTLCKHIILPNSTYSWWAAFLMKHLEKIVIATTFNPTFFSKGVGLESMKLWGKLYHPKDWIVINPFNGHMVVD